MSEARFAECGIHPHSDMDDIYTCVVCYHAQNAAAVALAKAVLAAESWIESGWDDNNDQELLELARAFLKASKGEK